MIVVHGATGTTGGMVARRLVARGVPVLLAGRDGARLAALGAELGAPHAIADAQDPAALVRAFRGAKVVVACAGPFATIGEPVLRAAITAGAHYVDVAGEQAFLRTTYERHEAAARHAGVCVVPGMAVEVAPGDLAAAWCAAWLSNEQDEDEDDEPVRAYELEVIAQDEPLDEIAVAYLLDRFVPTPATQRSAIAQLGETGVMWRCDRWDPVTPGLERRRINAGPELGERDAVSFPAGEVITVPRHVAVRRVQGYLSISKNDWVTRAAGFFAPALPLLGRRIPEKLASWVDAIGPDAHLRAGAQLAIVAQARRGFDEAQVVVAGHDVYATAAAIATWAATALLGRRDGPCGVLAPAEVFAPRAALRALAAEAALTITTSWGERW